MTPLQQAREIILTRGRVALVDEEDYDRMTVHKWCAAPFKGEYWYAGRGYRADGKQHFILMHREIMNAPIGKFVDHINHDTLDNRKANLRICNQSQNLANQNVQRITKTSRFKGVTWRKDCRKWRAQVYQNQHCIRLGLFETEEDAAAAYNLAAVIIFGEFAKPNELAEASP